MFLSVMIRKNSLDFLRKSPKNSYICEVLRVPNCGASQILKMGKVMCKRSNVGTYLRVNALQDNAQPCFSPLTITVGHSL